MKGRHDATTRLSDWLYASARDAISIWTEEDDQESFNGSVRQSWIVSPDRHKKRKLMKLLDPARRPLSILFRFAFVRRLSVCERDSPRQKGSPSLRLSPGKSVHEIPRGDTSAWNFSAKQWEKRCIDLLCTDNKTESFSRCFPSTRSQAYLHGVYAPDTARETRVTFLSSGKLS